MSGKIGRPRLELDAAGRAVVRRWVVEGFSFSAVARGLKLRGLYRNISVSTLRRRAREEYDAIPADNAIARREGSR